MTAGRTAPFPVVDCGLPRVRAILRARERSDMSEAERADSAVSLEVHDGVAILVMDRPDAMNAVDIRMASQLASALEEAVSDPCVRAVLLTGTGRAFCSGGDIRAMASALDADPRAFFAELTDSLHAITRSLQYARVPTIAAVNGPAAGFGFGLVLSCDLVVASERATFSMLHGQVAQIPDGGGWYLLPRVVGRKRALDLYLTRRVLDATDAERWGIVCRVLPATTFREVAIGFAREIACGPTVAYREAKRRMAEGWDQHLDDYLDAQREAIVALGGGRDFEEGVRAFLERRPPGFRGD
ncbi:MAG: enoyl-CoA hydratase-related protein [Gemmatimonadota bacterium]|nr:enoyl-CoA hydratase-related protein [Gemmatimonadota bacterium]